MSSPTPAERWRALPEWTRQTVFDSIERSLIRGAACRGLIADDMIAGQIEQAHVVATSVLRDAARRPKDYQREAMESDARLRAVGELLAENGCDCSCEHHPEECDDGCERCLACRINAALHAEGA